MCNVRDDSDHLVIERVTDVGETTMVESGASCQGSKCSLLVPLRRPVHRPVRIVADFGGAMQECQVGDVIARFEDEDLVSSDVLLLTLVVLGVGGVRASVVVGADALAPEVGVALKVTHSAVGLPVIGHTFPCADLRLVHILVVV